jgi:selenocysteine lyase/cysteine desulfurase
MNLTELLANEELRRCEFPVALDKVFLAHAAVCALPRRVAQAVADYAREASTGDQEKFVYPAMLEDGRNLAARFLGCAAEEVGFVGPTSLGLSLVASGLKFERGDNILIYFDDYPSNVYPWLALREQGVEVRMLPTRSAAELGAIRPGDVLAHVDDRTRLVALASCHFISGYRIDVSGIGRSLRERKILFCVDAIQTLGAFPLDLEHVDMLAADAHKWMLGPCGAGLLYIRRQVQQEVNPPIYGWHNVRCPDFIAQEKMLFRDDARKYEAGTHNLLGVVGLLAGLRLIMEIGIERISKELLRKRALLVSGLRAEGCSVLHGEASPECAGGIVSFHREGDDPSVLHEKLAKANIVASLRVDREQRRYIRLSPHFYNTDAELNRTLEVVERSLRRKS